MVQTLVGLAVVASWFALMIGGLLAMRLLR